MLKSFDFFRKIQTDQELTSATGGLFTLISLIVHTFTRRWQHSSSSTPFKIFTPSNTTPS